MHYYPLSRSIPKSSTWIMVIMTPEPSRRLQTWQNLLGRVGLIFNRSWIKYVNKSSHRSANGFLIVSLVRHFYVIYGWDLIPYSAIRNVTLSNLTRTLIRRLQQQYFFQSIPARTCQLAMLVFPRRSSFKYNNWEHEFRNGKVLSTYRQTMPYSFLVDRCLLSFPVM